MNHSVHHKIRTVELKPVFESLLCYKVHDLCGCHICI